jgi:hypothetical protein
MFSEKELNLPPRWFTGGEWANGTAQCALLIEYREAERRAAKERKKARAHRDDRPSLEKRFEMLTTGEVDNKGLSPMQACRILQQKL